MWWTLLLALLAVWLIGLLTGVAGAYVHLLLLPAITLLALALVRR